MKRRLKVEDVVDHHIDSCVKNTEALRRRLIGEAEAWMAVRPVSPSATYKALAPPYARRNAAACLRAAALLAEVQR
jgi:hypothetical protein